MRTGRCDRLLGTLAVAALTALGCGDNGTEPRPPDIDSQPNRSRDGRTLIFTSSRASGSGGTDLWMATRTH